MTHTAHTVGLILAGGRSRRMQGQDKSLLTVQGETLLAHVIRRLPPGGGTSTWSSSTG